MENTVFVVKVTYFAEVNKENQTETVFVNAENNHDALTQVEDYFGEKNIVSVCIYGTDVTFVTPNNMYDILSEARQEFWK